MSDIPTLNTLQTLNTLPTLNTLSAPNTLNTLSTDLSNYLVDDVDRVKTSSKYYAFLSDDLSTIYLYDYLYKYPIGSVKIVYNNNYKIRHYFGFTNTLDNHYIIFSYADIDVEKGEMIVNIIYWDFINFMFYSYYIPYDLPDDFDDFTIVDMKNKTKVPDISIKSNIDGSTLVLIFYIENGRGFTYNINIGFTLVFDSLNKIMYSITGNEMFEIPLICDNGTLIIFSEDDRQHMTYWYKSENYLMHKYHIPSDDNDLWVVDTKSGVILYTYRSRLFLYDPEELLPKQIDISKYIKDKVTETPYGMFSGYNFTERDEKLLDIFYTNKDDKLSNVSVVIDKNKEVFFLSENEKIPFSINRHKKSNTRNEYDEYLSAKNLPEQFKDLLDIDIIISNLDKLRQIVKLSKVRYDTFADGVLVNIIGKYLNDLTIYYSDNMIMFLINYLRGKYPNIKTVAQFEEQLKQSFYAFVIE